MFSGEFAVSPPLSRRVEKNETSIAECPGQRRENEDPTADRPDSLHYYPRLWSSGTGVLSRNSLSQKATERKARDPVSPPPSDFFFSSQ